MTHARTSSSSSRSRWFLLAFGGGAVLSLGSVLSVGCGGSTSGNGNPTTTVAATDSGVGSTDSAAATDSSVATETGDDSSTTTPTTDGGSTAPLSDGFTIDPEASLLDLGVPDVVVGDVSVPVCYGCIEKNCSTQLAKCDADPKCKNTVICVIDTCGGFTGTSCLISCALKSGVSGITDPAVGEAQAVGTCAQSSCSSACGTAGFGGG